MQFTQSAMFAVRHTYFQPRDLFMHLLHFPNCTHISRDLVLAWSHKVFHLTKTVLVQLSFIGIIYSQMIYKIICILAAAATTTTACFDQ